MPMRTEYVEPEVAFEVRYQCSEAVIQQHCDAAPDNDRRDFDDKGGLTFEIYHTYKDNDFGSRCAFWYTTDIDEDEQFDFDIRDIFFHIPGFKELYTSSTNTLERYGPDRDQRILQLALDTDAVHFDNGRLVIGGASCRAQG